MTPKIAILKTISHEADNVKGFTFNFNNLNSQPGQFVMLWLPGVDQKPFSIAADNGKTFTTVVFKLKNFTTALFKLKPGAKVGVSGPYGNPYTWKPKQHVIAVGGGYGAAPLVYLINTVKKQQCSYELLVGARTKDLLLYTDHFPKHTFLSTNDGSTGYKGFITGVLEQRLQTITKTQLKHTTVYVCGPEPMEYAVAMLAKKYGVESQISVERYMKCGFGVCGQCCMDDTGEPMCQVGPVITGKKALSLTEFGKYHRDKSGQIINY
ncbi:MAG: dihydroorotate dehydrogenase electron transfer subunit [Patescibacteria group bacterium]|jgi:dihydroorotate dehydrogenase electron transfer subunit